MNVKLLFSLFLFSISVALFAQEDELKTKFAYSSITEFGLMTTSPRGFSFEATTTHGFSLDKKHHLGIGIGIGYNYNNKYYSGPIIFYMPIFANYRVYFKPDKSFSPHFNLALGGFMLKKGGGAYSSACIGFKVGKFTLSQGLSFFALQKEEVWGETIWISDPYWAGEFYSTYQERREMKWYFPVGLTFKWGFTF